MCRCYNDRATKKKMCGCNGYMYLQFMATGEKVKQFDWETIAIQANIFLQENVCACMFSHMNLLSFKGKERRN